MTLLRLSFLSLLACLGLMATSLHAQQLQQPASIVPWRAPTHAAKLLLSNPADIGSNESPSWLLDSPRQLPSATTAKQNLPMVEAESFVDLGQLKADSEHSRRLATQGTRHGRMRNNTAFNLFRALGLPVKRPSSNR